MIKQFRVLTPLNLFLLVIITVLLRVWILIQLPENLDFSFEEFFVRLLLPVPEKSFLSPEFDVLAATVIVFIQAALINKIISEYNLLGKPSFLPALMYVTASSILGPFLILSPVLICNFLLIWLIEKILSIYRRNEVGSVMFDMGVIVAIGTLLYFPFIALFPVLYLSLLIFRPFNWREWITGLVGFALVYFFLAVFYFWNDSIDKFYLIWLPLTTPFPNNLKINFYDYIVLIPLIVILIFSGFSIRQNFFRSYVQVRKSFQLLTFMFILVMISFYLKPEVRIYHFLLGAPAAAIFMAYYFLNAKKSWLYETLYLSLLAFIIYFQIF